MSQASRSPAPLPPPLDPATWRRILEEASDAIFVTDETLRIAWVNRRASEVLHHPSDALVGRRVAELFWDPDELVRSPLRREDMAGSGAMTRRAFRAGDGSRVWLEVSAKFVGSGLWVGIARDVTDRVLAEERLSRSEQSFRALIEGSPDGIVVHAQGVVLYANSALATLLGEPSSEGLVGRRMIDAVHPDDREQVFARVSAIVAGEATVPFVEERLLRADGRAVTVATRGVGVDFEGQRCVLAIVRDVTEQRRMQAQLAQGERMASLGQLAAGVAHEINNPLTYTLLRLEAMVRWGDRLERAKRRLEEALAERLGPDAATALVDQHLGAVLVDEIRGHAETAAEGARRVQRIVSDLRVFCRVDTDERAIVDVEGPIELALSMAAHELKHRARVVRDFGEVPPVLAGEGRLAQIFLNLLLNAAYAIPEGAPEQNEIRLTTRVADGRVSIAIRDSGVGIPPEHLPRLFEPFFTTKPIGEGSGLGLAMCHGIVSSLGGVLRVESRVGEGSTFTVELPASSAPPTPPPPAPRAPRTPAHKGRVLVIDDEPAITEALAIVLAPLAEIVVLPGAEQAQELLLGGADFDLILCDVVMPGMTGTELHEWLAARRPALAARMLFMSGGRLSDAQRALADLDPARWIEKPLDLERLERRVVDLLEGRGTPPQGLTIGNVK